MRYIVSRAHETKYEGTPTFIVFAAISAVSLGLSLTEDQLTIFSCDVSACLQLLSGCFLISAWALV